jgi:hypothetical protein
MNREKLKDTFIEMKEEKEMITELITPYLLGADLNSNKGKQKRQELIDIAKFIISSKENIKILPGQFTEPDFLVEWDNIKFGLEHTEVIDRKKKDTFEKTQRLIEKTGKIFLERYGEINRQINFSLKFEVTKITKKEKKKLLDKLRVGYKDLHWDPQKLMNLAYPGLMTSEDIQIIAGQLAEMAYLVFMNGNEEISNDLVNYISIRTSKKTVFTRSVGWSAGSISDKVIASIEEKEAKIDTYIQNTNGLKQCLFLIIQGSNGYSDYASFDDKILADRGSQFDKVVAFNFFTRDFFILK